MSFFFLLMVTMDVDNVTNDGIWSVVQLRLECSKGAESTIPLPYNTTPVHRETLRGRNSCRNLYTSQYRSRAKLFVWQIIVKCVVVVQIELLFNFKKNIYFYFYLFNSFCITKVWQRCMVLRSQYSPLSRPKYPWRCIRSHPFGRKCQNYMGRRIIPS